jgi:monoamine oxidase
MMQLDRDTADRVLIVGGGLSGLITAYELERLGIRSLVLEADSRVGGRVSTVAFADGVTAEAYLEEFWEGSPAHDVLRRFDLPLVERPAFSSIVLGGRLRRYGGGPGGIEALFDAADREGFRRWNRIAQQVLDHLSSVGSTASPASLASLREVSFASYVDALRLPVDVASWIRVSVEAEVAVEWHHISALDGIVEMRPFVVSPGTSHTGASLVVRGGNDRLVDRLVAELPSDAIRTGCRVERIVDRGDAGVEISYRDATGHTHLERGHHAVVAVPVWSIGRIAIDPPLSALAQLAIGTARAGSYVKVLLRLRPDARSMWNGCWDEGFALLSDGPAGCIYLHEPVSDGADLVLTALAYGRWARMLNGRSAGEIVDRIIAAIDRLLDQHLPAGRRGPAPTLARVVTGSRVFDCPKAVAYWPHGLGRSRFDQMADALRSPHGRIMLAGDSTESSHSDGAVRAAMRVVHAICQHVNAPVVMAS